MSRRIIVSAFIAILCMALSIPVQASPANSSPSASVGAQGLAPLHFTENRGQWDERVLYKAEGAGGLTYFIERDGFTLLYSMPDLTAKPLENPRDVGMPEEMTRNEPKIYPQKGHALKFKFIQSSVVPTAVGATSTSNAASQSPNIPSTSTSTLTSTRLSWNNNYFLGNDPTHWAPNCGNFGGVKLNDVWKGIDVEWYESNGHAEFDFVVNPGADPSQVGVKIEGLTGDMEATGGGEELLLPTSLGTLRFTLPEAYQVGDGSKSNPVPAHFIVTGANHLGLALPEGYDASKKLIVDPLVYSTYIGGASADLGDAMVSDGAGGVIVAGWTASNDFPATGGAYDNSFNSQRDAFVARLNADGSQLAYCTYLGGASTDSAFALLSEGDGVVVVTGVTQSNNFPTTEGAYDRSYNGNGDIFVSRLSADGSQLLRSTYFGAAFSEVAYGIISDGAGGMFITGYASSGGAFPTTNGAYDTSVNGFRDVFVADLSGDLSQLLYGTLLGGSGKEQAQAIAPDGAGGVVIAGSTTSGDFPTVGALDGSLTGATDAFVARFNGHLSELLYSTYLGGSGVEAVYAVASDGAGGVFVAGPTTSNNFPTTGGAFSQALHDTSDAFVARINQDGSQLLYSTYLGGGNGDGAFALTADGAGGIIVAGYTVSNNFPTTNDGYDRAINGNSDAFVARLSGDLHSLLYGSYLGGGGADHAYALVSDGTGQIFVAGDTYSNDFPTSGGAFDQGYNAGGDVFVACLEGMANRPPVLAAIGNKTICECYPLTITLSATDPDGNPLTYEVDNAPAGSSLTDNVFTWTPAHNGAGSYTPTFRVLDNGAPPLHDEETITITVQSVINIPSEYGTIQAAINASHNGDIILVEPGTYTESITLTGHNVTLASRYLYSGSQTDIDGTIIHGAGGNSVVTSGTDNSATLTGFTITGGTGRTGKYGGGIYLLHSAMTICYCIITSNIAQYGGGIYATGTNAASIIGCWIWGNVAPSNGAGIYLTTSSLNITSTDFLGNAAEAQGGGLWMSNSHPTIQRCTFTGNDAPGGAGIYAVSSNSAIISNSTLSSNTASGTGGGISMTSSSLTLDGCTFSSNTAATLGGGIRISGGHPTIQNCTVSGNSAAQGGGVNVMNATGTAFTNCTFSSNTSTTLGGGMTISTSDATIDNCVFDGNNGGIQGGGLRIYTCGPTITNSTFSSNTAAQGGGIYAASAGATHLTNDTLRNNTGTTLGGGMQLTSSNLTMDGCVISGNTAPQGAGMRLYISSPTVTHTAITDNNASTGAKYGGGFVCASGSNPTFTQCTFSNNAARLGGLVWCYAGGNPVFNTCILYNDAPQEIYFHTTGAANSVSLAYCDLKGGQAGIKTNHNGTVTWGGGNFDNYPLFVGPGDYRLDAGSPCIDTGDPGLTDDPDATRADVGAYFYDQGHRRAPGLEVPKEATETPKEFALNSSFPNPFNSFTTIRFSLKEDSKARLTVYDLSGREVATLANGDLKAGSHSAVWNAQGFTSGIYLARLSTSTGFVATRKLTLLK